MWTQIVTQIKDGDFQIKFLNNLILKKLFV